MGDSPREAPPIMPMRKLAVALATLTVAAAAAAEPVTVEYVVQKKAFRDFESSDVLVFELYEDESCSEALGAYPLFGGDEDVRFFVDKHQRVAGAKLRAAGVRIRAVIDGPVLAHAPYLRVSGPGVVALGEACQLQAGTPVAGSGPSGPAGPMGPAGSAGAAGADGAMGAQGPAGAPGPQGPAGADGETGQAGPMGPAGADGATGPQGPAGVDGEMGPVGPTGPAGADGAPGLQGPAGTDGAMGPQGPAGADGAPGPQGEPGPAGTAGMSVEAEVSATSLSGTVSTALAGSSTDPERLCFLTGVDVLEIDSLDENGACRVIFDGASGWRLDVTTGAGNASTTCHARCLAW